MSTPTSTTYTPTAALRWNRLACDAIYYTKTMPTIAARALAMVHEAMYNAWTNYNDGGSEISTSTFDRLKRPFNECTAENRVMAYSYAAYRVLQDLFCAALSPERKHMFRDFMCELGFDPDDRSLNATKPQGIGNISAMLVLECRHGDGSNQRGTLAAGHYADYTGYYPANPPVPQPLRNREKWQPQLDADGQPQKSLTTHWGLVKPFALEWGGQLRPKKPAAQRDALFREQAADVLILSKCLNDEHKLIAEYWAGMHEDKHADAAADPNPGYWNVPPTQCCRMARFISQKYQFKNANDIKMFFAVSMGLLDAAIASWDAKYYYDYIRPVSAIHDLFDGQDVDAWGGPCQGSVSIKGQNWIPYLIHTPPFAEYVSGHSTFSRTVADILTSFCGNNAYGESVTFPVNSSKIEQNCPTPVPQTNLTLCWKTFQEASDQAGMSRRYGGIHFEQGDVEGRMLGKRVAVAVWDKACRYFSGKLT
ncbi:MAG: vanadium-dependent haloperoxidase [Saprospirales bacterium]|nr:vanadium-dependent haloperoxidase [Saprospirales bacterium]